MNNLLSILASDEEPVINNENIRFFVCEDQNNIKSENIFGDTSNKMKIENFILRATKIKSTMECFNSNVDALFDNKYGIENIYKITPYQKRVLDGLKNDSSNNYNLLENLISSLDKLLELNVLSKEQEDYINQTLNLFDSGNFVELTIQINEAMLGKRIEDIFTLLDKKYKDYISVLSKKILWNISDIYSQINVLYKNDEKNKNDQELTEGKEDEDDLFVNSSYNVKNYNQNFNLDSNDDAEIKNHIVNLEATSPKNTEIIDFSREIISDFRKCCRMLEKDPSKNKKLLLKIILRISILLQEINGLLLSDDDNDKNKIFKALIIDIYQLLYRQDITLSDSGKLSIIEYIEYLSTKGNDDEIKLFSLSLEKKFIELSILKPYIEIKKDSSETTKAEELNNHFLNSRHFADNAFGGINENYKELLKLLERTSSTVRNYIEILNERSSMVNEKMTTIDPSDSNKAILENAIKKIEEIKTIKDDLLIVIKK